ncbi:MAG: FAD-dependent monooxygenase [Proteobacteria bacterium]|nr:FAD-dependent monooxygenase [Pseudomonadota bacterium]
MHDVAIIGAGPVGATLALGLARTGRDVVVLDARAAHTDARGERSLALSHGGRLILERTGAWSALAATPGALTPIVAIDVSQARGFGSATLSAADVGVPALGYVASSTALQRALDEALVRAGIAVRFGVRAQSLATSASAPEATLTLDDGAPVAARLVVVADGGALAIPGIERVHHDYGQVALIADVTPAAPHRGIAYERFTPGGPVALLPRGDHYGLVWTQTPEQATRTLALDDAAFLATLARHAGRHLGRLTAVGTRRTFPLTLEYARPRVAPRVVLLGNAAQTLHPVAGQGFNVGLRDAHELAALLARSDASDWGSADVVGAFARGRRNDRAAGIALTHGLTRIFAGGHPLVAWPRGLALTLLDTLPPARRAFTRAMLFGMH